MGADASSSFLLFMAEGGVVTPRSNGIVEVPAKERARGAAGLTAARPPASSPPMPSLHRWGTVTSTPVTDASSRGPGGYCRYYGNQGPSSQLRIGPGHIKAIGRIECAPREPR